MSQIAHCSLLITLWFLLVFSFDSPAQSFSIDRVWSTYYGGTGDESILGSCIDSQGNIYITGSTTSASGITTPGAYQGQLAGTKDAYLVKFSPDGIRIWGTYFGGESNDVGWSIAIEGSSAVYLTGVTTSATGIASPGAFQPSLNGYNDAFLVRFNADGQRIWSTYLGGNDLDAAYTCCLDADGNVFIAGGSHSIDVIATQGAHQQFPGGGYDGFLEKFSPAGQRIWGTYYGVTGDESFSGCSASVDGHIYLSGSTESLTSIATPGVFRPSYSGAFDGFLVSFRTNGERDWGTYFGGPAYDAGTSVAVTDNGVTYLCGNTFSTDGIVSQGAHQDSLRGINDAFLARFDTNGQCLWSTYFGGEDKEEGRSVAINENGMVILGGMTTSSSGITTPNGFQADAGGAKDAFLAIFTDGGQQAWGSYYGAMADDENYPTVTGPGHTVYFGGLTGSTDSIATPGSHQLVFGGGVRDGFLVRFDEVQVGIHQKMNDSFSVYPNPNHGEFRITGRYMLKEAISFDISDISGRIVYSEKGIVQNGNFSRDVPVNLVPGIYFAVLYSGHREIMQVITIVIL